MIVVPQTAKQNAKSSTRKKSSTQNRRRAEDRLLGRHRRSDAPCYVLRRRWRTLDLGRSGGSGLFKTNPPLLATYRRNHNGPGTTLDQILISCCTPLRLLLVRPLLAVLLARTDLLRPMNVVTYFNTSSSNRWAHIPGSLDNNHRPALTDPPVKMLGMDATISMAGATVSMDDVLKYLSTDTAEIREAVLTSPGYKTWVRPYIEAGRAPQRDDTSLALSYYTRDSDGNTASVATPDVTVADDDDYTALTTNRSYDSYSTRGSRSTMCSQYTHNTYGTQYSQYTQDSFPAVDRRSSGRKGGRILPFFGSKAARAPKQAGAPATFKVKVEDDDGSNIELTLEEKGSYESLVAKNSYESLLTKNSYESLMTKNSYESCSTRGSRSTMFSQYTHNTYGSRYSQYTRDTQYDDQSSGRKIGRFRPFASSSASRSSSVPGSKWNSWTSATAGHSPDIETPGRREAEIKVLTNELLAIEEELTRQLNNEAAEDAERREEIRRRVEIIERLIEEVKKTEVEEVREIVRVMSDMTSAASMKSDGGDSVVTEVREEAEEDNTGVREEPEENDTEVREEAEEDSVATEMATLTTIVESNDVPVEDSSVFHGLGEMLQGISESLSFKNQNTSESLSYKSQKETKVESQKETKVEDSCKQTKSTLQIKSTKGSIKKNIVSFEKSPHSLHFLD